MSSNQLCVKSKAGKFEEQRYHTYWMVAIFGLIRTDLTPASFKALRACDPENISLPLNSSCKRDPHQNNQTLPPVLSSSLRNLVSHVYVEPCPLHTSRSNDQYFLDTNQVLCSLDNTTLNITCRLGHFLSRDIEPNARAYTSNGDPFRLLQRVRSLP